MLYANIKAPCYKCEDRFVGCHSKCPEYAKFVDLMGAVKRKVIEENIIRDTEITNVVARNERRRRLHSCR